MTFTAMRWRISFLHKCALLMDKNLLKYAISYCKKKKITHILKSHFLKTGFFQISFLKSHNSVSF